MESRNGMIVGKHTHKLSIISYHYKSKCVCTIRVKCLYVFRINVRFVRIIF